MALVLGNGSYLLLFGGGKLLLDGDPGAISHALAPSWRTVNLGNGTTTVTWTNPLDPNELKNYTIDCSVEMDGISNRIASVSLVLSPLAVAAGLRIYGITNDMTNITVWFQIDEDERNHPGWEPPGEIHTLLCTVNAMDGQIFERTIALPIRRLGQSL